MPSEPRRRVSSPSVPEPAPGTFSRAIQVGNPLFVAGMTANSPDGVEGGDSMYEQTRAVFRKIQRLVEAAGGRMNDIVKMTGFVTDMSNATSICGHARVSSPPIRRRQRWSRSRRSLPRASSSKSRCWP
jgi:enamine deaminase RidA (YjgF/YER057c/UK114 family)